MTGDPQIVRNRMADYVRSAAGGYKAGGYKAAIEESQHTA